MAISAENSAILHAELKDPQTADDINEIASLKKNWYKEIEPGLWEKSEVKKTTIKNLLDNLKSLLNSPFKKTN